MKNRRLVKYLSILTDDECSLLARYLSSPYFVYRTNLAKLLAWLRKFAPDFDISKVEEDAFKAQLLGKKASQQSWNRLLSDFTKEVHKMLAVTHFLEDERAVDYHTVKALEHRASNYPFKNSLNNHVSTLPSVWDEMSYDYHWLMLELMVSDSNKDKHHKQVDYWQIYTNLFEVNTAEYVYKYLKLQVVSWSGRKLVKLPDLEKNTIFDQTLLLQAAQKLQDKHPLIKAYYLLLQAYLHFEDVSRFHDFQDFVLQSDDIIEPSEQLTLSRLGINYCVQKQASSNDIVFLAYEKMAILLRASFEEANRKGISDHLFLNLALLFLVKESWDSYRKWVESCKSLLPPDWKDSCLQLAEAYRFFFMKDFQAANDMLERINSRQLRYALRYQSLKVRVAYELHCQSPDVLWLGDQLEGRVTAFRSFLNHRSKHQITDLKKQQYINFIVVLKEIIKVSRISAVSPAQVEGLNQLVEEKSPPLESWLSDKIKALIEPGA